MHCYLCFCLYCLLDVDKQIVQILGELGQNGSIICLLAALLAAHVNFHDVSCFRAWRPCVIKSPGPLNGNMKQLFFTLVITWV